MGERKNKNFDFQHCFETLPDLFLVVDRELCVTALTDGCLKLATSKREECVGRSLFEIPFYKTGGLLASEVETVREQCERAFRGEHVFGKKNWIKATAKNVTDRCFRISCRPLVIEGSVEYVAHHIDDLTEAENFAREVSNELQDFSYSISHDLKAPLRGILGFSQMVLEEHKDALGEAGCAQIEKVQRAAEKMSVLIDGLLGLSRLTGAELKPGVVDLSAMAEDIFERLRKENPARPQRLIAHPGLLTKGDPRLIRALMESLIGNAWKFSAKNESVEIEFGARGDEAGGKIFFVRDSGAGFDMRYAEKLFGVFQRMHPAREFSGIGVGLAAARKIIRRHGGRIWAEAEAGKGATFFFQV